MKNSYLLLSFFLAIVCSNAQINNYNNGDTVNDFTVVDVYGNTHNLYNYTAEGKYVFIDFFYAACGGCQNFMPVFNEFYDKYGCNEGEIVCISINSGVDKDADVIAFENTYGGPFNHAPAISLDGGCEAVITDFDPIYYPACVMIGPGNLMVNNDIYPIDNVADIEAAFPVDFNPQPLNCTLITEEIADTSSISIFPNPNNGQSLMIRMNNSMKSKIIIYNILGEKVFVDQMTGSFKEIKTDLKPGSYLISLQTKQASTVRKLIVQ